MVSRLISFLIAFLIVCPLNAQDGNETPVRVGDIVSNYSKLMMLCSENGVDVSHSKALHRQLTKLTPAHIQSLTLDQVVGKSQMVSSIAFPGFLERVRGKAAGGPDVQAMLDLNTALDSLLMVTNMGNGLAQAVIGLDASVITQDAADSLMAPLTLDYEILQTQKSLDTSLERLRRFEHKFGPGAPRLNGLEAALNYLAQYTPWFGVNEEGDPSPLEVIAAYSTTYLTWKDDDPRMFSGAEFGLRIYNFSKKTGSLKSPKWFSIGALVAGENPGPLVWPWRGESNIGVFAGWGSFKVAYVFDDVNRLFVTRQVQIIPFVF